MKKIKLTKGKYAIVDDEDYRFLNNLSWQAHKQPKATTVGEEHWHAVLRINSSFVGQTKKTRKKATIYMEQFLIRVPPNYKINHINRNTLDNRKTNLRKTTQSKSLAYARKRAGTTSKHKGVTYCKNKKDDKKWSATIVKNNKRYYLGYYETEDEAGLAYNKKARELYQEFAYENDL